jgi:monofunctional biosynthetic peptidoglycan transglycosylase
MAGRSYIRKGLEAYFTVLIELVWGKERIMEVYLNSIEMGMEFMEPSGI